PRPPCPAPFPYTTLFRSRVPVFPVNVNNRTLEVCARIGTLARFSPNSICDSVVDADVNEERVVYRGRAYVGRYRKVIFVSDNLFPRQANQSLVQSLRIARLQFSE